MATGQITPPPGFQLEESQQSGQITPPPGFVLEGPPPVVQSFPDERSWLQKKLGSGIGALAREGTLGAASMVGLPETTHASDFAIAPGMWQILRHPIESAKLLAEPIAQSHEDMFQRGQEEMQNPGLANKFSGLVHAAGAAIPLVGPAMVNTGEEIGQGLGSTDWEKAGRGIASGNWEQAKQGLASGDWEKVAHGAGGAAGLIGSLALGTKKGQAVTDTAITKVGGAVADRASSAVQGVRAAFSPEAMTAEQAATKAFRPRNSKANWKAEVASALPDAKRAADTLGVDIKKMTLDDAMNATSQAKKEVWSEYEQNYTAPNQKVLAPTDAVADRIRATVSQRTVEQRPGLARQINRIADSYDGRALSLEEIENRVRELNNETRAIEARYITDKRAAKLATKNSPVFAERDALKGILLDKLDQLAGPGAAQLRQRWGALNSLEDVISRRIPVAQRAAPVNLLDMMSDLWSKSKLVRGMVTMNPGDFIEGGIGLLARRNAKLLNDPNYLTSLAFRKTTARPPMIPRVQGQYVPPPYTSPIPQGIPRPLQLQAGQQQNLPPGQYQAPPSPVQPPRQLEHMQPIEGQYMEPPPVMPRGLLPRGVYQQPGGFELTQPQLPEKAAPVPIGEGGGPTYSGAPPARGMTEKEIAAARKQIAPSEGEQSRPFVGPESSKTYGTQNRLVSQEEAAVARKNLQSKLFRSHAGLDPTMLADAAKLGTYHLEAGAREFAAWSQKMVQELGEEIRPHLQAIWQQVQGGPDVPTFYSKAAKVSAEKIGGSASGDQILSTLQNAGVKADEIKWMGLDDYLKGKAKVSKQELQQFISDNQIHLEESQRGGAGAEQLRDLGAKRDKVFAENNRIWADHLRYSEHGSDLFNSMNTGDVESTIKQMPEKLQAPARRFVETDKLIHKYDSEMVRIQKTSSNAKFESKTLPGEKQNYTEMLLRLPERSSEADQRIAAIRARLDEISNLPSRTHNEQRQAISREWDALNAEKNRLIRESPAENPFRSGHFDEPNVLAHVRFDDRIDAAGKKTLFIEEVQSDWHQKGKRDGYKSMAPPAKAENKGGYFEVTDKDGNFITNVYDTTAATPEAAMAEAVRRLRENPQSTAGGQRVPDAPFKSDWHELAMKRMLRHAAEHGYDRIAWTTGEQQAARYDLAKHVAKIEWYPKKDGTGTLYAINHTGDAVLDKQIKASEIGDYIGKEPARKLLESQMETSESGRRQWHSISGLDLKVGGEWAKALYDRAIPHFLNKYGKKWGAKVGQTQLGSAVENIRVENWDSDNFVIVHNRGGRVYDIADTWQDPTNMRLKPKTFDTKEGAMAFAKKAGMIRETQEPVHSIDVTPGMKKSVLKEGQPISKVQPLRPAFLRQSLPETA